MKMCRSSVAVQHCVHFFILRFALYSFCVVSNSPPVLFYFEIAITFVFITFSIICKKHKVQQNVTAVQVTLITINTICNSYNCGLYIKMNHIVWQCTLKNINLIFFFTCEWLIPSYCIAINASVSLLSGLVMSISVIKAGWLLNS